MRAGGALSIEDADADGFRSRFLQGFDLAEANQGREFVAFADDALGGSRAAGHGAADDLLGERFQVSFGLSFENCFRHSQNRSPQRHREKQILGKNHSPQTFRSYQGMNPNIEFRFSLCLRVAVVNRFIA